MPFSSRTRSPPAPRRSSTTARVAEHYKLNVKQYHTVDSVSGRDGEFAVHTTIVFGEQRRFAPAS